VPAIAAAALIAAASLSAPLAVGPAARLPSENFIPLLVEPDPRAGAWLHFPAPDGERLLHMDEDGHVTSIGLPRKLRGEELAITGLRDGWTVATDRYWSGGRAQEERCQPSFATPRRLSSNAAGSAGAVANSSLPSVVPSAAGRMSRRWPVPKIPNRG
jgi:hypothetical protein